VGKYTRKIKTFFGQSKRRITKISTSKYLQGRRVWAGGIVVIILIIFWILPAFAAKAPGQMGYSIKRGEEWLVANLAPLPNWRENLRLDFANNRVNEAAYVADHANRHSVTDTSKTTATINNLLGSYESAYEPVLDELDKQLNAGKKPEQEAIKDHQDDVVNIYTTLQLLRLQAPPTSQLAVLTAVDDTQRYLAALNDALGTVPLSASDFAQLARLSSIGVISPAAVTSLSNVKNSRQLHAALVSMVNDGQLPADASYNLDYDVVKHIAPTKAAAFQTEAQFEEMQRISAVLTASRPTAEQKQAIQAFLTSYKPGQQTASSDIQPYVTPIVYGMALSGQLQGNLLSLSAVRMNSDDQALFDTWKVVLDPPNLSDTYQTLMTDAQSQPALHLRNLAQTQAELTAAQKAQVTYLVMPPGWGVNQLATLNKQMGVEIAETSFAQSKPNANQELASITITQLSLQNELQQLQAAYNANTTKLETQINNFQGTADQVTQLKQELSSLTQSQATTIADLQAQITYITDAHTTLGGTITNLQQQQVTNLTELELRAATTAQTISDTTKAQLTASLNQVNSTSQTLITNLSTHIDNLGITHVALRDRLNDEITTIKNNYQELKADVQDQINAGVTTTVDLQTTLTQTRTELATQTTALTNLGSSTTALTQLVDQVKNNSQSDLHDLQGQINDIKLDQQAIKTATADLQNITQTSQALTNELQAKINSLGSSQAQLRTELTNEINTVKDTYDQLREDTQAQLDAGNATSAQLQTILTQVRDELTTQKASVAQLGSSHDVLSQLVGQIKTTSETGLTDLQVQIGAVHLDQQTTQTAVNSLQSITQTSQALISGLQARTDALDSSQSQLRQELTADIQTVQSDYTTLTAGLQAQINAGIATTTSLTTSLQTIQSNLVAQAAELASLGTSHTTLTALVNQVQTTANAQTADLQGQINALDISSQSVKHSLESLAAKQAADLTGLTNQLADLHVVQIEAQADIADLVQAQASTQADTNALHTGFDTLQTTLQDSLTVQASIQADLSNQQSELDTITAQTQSALDTLTAQQSILDAQLTNISNNTTSLSQAINTVQTAANTTQTTLDTLLANAPWAIPSGTYVTQADFNTLTAQLNTQFAQKAAQLDAQFQAYQQTLNASVDQLNTQLNNLSTTVTNTANAQAATQVQVNGLSTTVTTNQTSAQNQINTLSSQVQTLQQQVQQLLHPGL